MVDIKPKTEDNVRSLEELSRAVDLLNKSLKAVTFRNLAVIAILVMIGLPTYISFWLLKLENRSVLWDVFGQSKVVKVVGECPTVRTVGVNGEVVYTTYLQYRSTPSPFIVAILRPNLNNIDDVTVCEQLTEDRDKLLNRAVKGEKQPGNSTVPTQR